MAHPDRFIALLGNEFPDDRLTFQKNVPTFHPESAEEAARLFRLANHHRQPLYITGFGNNIDPVGEAFEELIVVRTDRLNDLLTIAPEDFYVRVEAGYPLRELNEHLEPEGLFMPHASLPYVGSVGGAVAVNLNATHQGHDLPIRRYLIETQVVTPEGEIIKPGSVCFKSVSGYDVAKIFAPSWGLLGLIVSATFRVFPLSAKDEYGDLAMQAVDPTSFLAALAETNESNDALYARKIKRKFDPRGVLPTDVVRGRYGNHD
ncbi:MAG: FAD-binding oxidoreductase [Candidatus Zixiibacteriota bacterium]|nr:MAG: FAD-binding oxidoreductase [candidate division Zixibacteria bacterium]